MRGVWGLNEAVLPLVQSILGFQRPFENAVALGLVSGDKIVGGVVFHNWAPEHGVIEVTAASTSRKWFTRAILRQITRYAFEICGCHAIVARTAPDNEPVLKIWRALGAEEVSIPHLRGRGVPEVVFILTDAQWGKSRFSESRNG